MIFNAILGLVLSFLCGAAFTVYVGNRTISSKEQPFLDAILFFAIILVLVPIIFVGIWAMSVLANLVAFLWSDVNPTYVLVSFLVVLVIAGYSLLRTKHIREVAE